MWTRRTSSGSQEHPTPKHLVRAMLARLIEKAGSSSWAHFEVISEAGWFRNELYGEQPWVEVAYVNERSLQLNLGVSMKKPGCTPKMPERWESSRKGLWTVPISDTEALADWVDACLAAVSGRPQYHVSGWIEGL